MDQRARNYRRSVLALGGFAVIHFTTLLTESRAVYEDDEDDGRRQFVMDEETSEPVYGVWLDLAEPQLVARPT